MFNFFKCCFVWIKFSEIWSNIRSYKDSESNKLRQAPKLNKEQNFEKYWYTFFNHIADQLFWTPPSHSSFA